MSRLNLLEWLDQKGAKELFLANIPEGDMSYTMRRINQYDYGFGITSGFIWKTTPEGQEYWGELNDEWMKYSSQFHAQPEEMITNTFIDEVVQVSPPTDEVRHVNHKSIDVLDRVKGALTERGDQYGRFEDNIQDIRVIASQMSKKDFTEKDILNVLLALKLGRLAHSVKPDTIDDLIGYGTMYSRINLQ